jgi:hypothetical protein
LIAEWRLVIRMADSGMLVIIAADSHADATAKGRRCGHGTWHVERRFTTAWEPTTTELRSLVVPADRKLRVDPGVEAPGDGH